MIFIKQHYLPPTIKVVKFKVEDGFTVSLRNQSTTNTPADDNLPNISGEQMTFSQANDWGTI